jgi:hypothetical protein
MRVVDASIDDTDCHPLAQDALLVQLAHAGRVVGGVVGRRGIVTVAVNGDGCKGDFLVQPDADDILQLIEIVRVELVGGDTDAVEDIAVECANDLNAVGVADLLLALVQRALHPISQNNHSLIFHPTLL